MLIEFTSALLAKQYYERKLLCPFNLWYEAFDVVNLSIAMCPTHLLQYSASTFWDRDS
jgi:hypothetical protein